MKFHPLANPAAEVRTGGTTGKVGSFGMTRNGGRKMHKGVDWLAPYGAPVYAAHPGVVSDAGFQKLPSGTRANVGYGLRVYLDQDTGPNVRTIYAHLSGCQVAAGERVVAGQLLGWVGRTGNVEASCPTHLHYEVRIGGEPVDPVEFHA